MRIESVEAIPSAGACYVRVRAEDGMAGVGESTFFGWPSAVAEIAGSFGSYLVGRDPFDVEHHLLALYRALSFRGMAVTGALAALDQALWDLKGKHFEVPVWQLLGRARPQSRARHARGRRRHSGAGRGGRPARRPGRGLYGAQGPPVPARAPRDATSAAHRRPRRPLRGDTRDRRLADRPGRRAAPQHERRRRPAPLRRARPLPPYVRRGSHPARQRNSTSGFRRQLAPAGGCRRAQHRRSGSSPSTSSGRVSPSPAPTSGSRAGSLTSARSALSPRSVHAGVLPHAVPSGPVAVAAHVQLGMCTPNWELQEHVPQDGPHGPTSSTM